LSAHPLHQKIFSSNDELFEQATGQSPPVAIFPSAPNEFFAVVFDAQFAFERDGGEKVVAVIVRVIRAPRRVTDCLPECVGTTAGVPRIAADLLQRHISAVLGQQRTTNVEQAFVRKRQSVTSWLRA
jgi:hypothetical protein